jgi:hypothetical protein
MRPNPTAHNANRQLDRRKPAFDTANALGGLIGGWLGVLLSPLPGRLRLENNWTSRRMLGFLSCKSLIPF